MKIAILQLSDIHISTEKWPDNPVLSRQENIVAAIKARFLPDQDAVLLLLNGDIAYAGLSAEYELAKTFLKSVQDGLASLFPNAAHHTILMPGNHDCDFHRDNKARAALIDDPDLASFDDGSIVDICTRVQDDFFTFCAEFQSLSAVPTGMSRIISEHTFAIGSDDINVRVLNTAWGSRMHERSGSLFLPVKLLRLALTKDTGARLVITAFHHPYAWLETNNAREFRKAVEESSDLIFTGHEHERQSYSKTKFVGEHNEYIEAGPLQENNSPAQSEFNLVVVDSESAEYIVHHFSWNDGEYELVNDNVTRPFIRNNSRLRSEFEINEGFLIDLRDTDTKYHHPYKEEVTLDDLFIYPDLREYSPLAADKEKAASGSKGPEQRGRNEHKPREKPTDGVQFQRKTIKSREVLDYILNKAHVVVSAPDKAGKTALGRHLFTDLWRNGRIPLLVDASAIDTKTPGAIGKFFDDLYSRQYRSPRSSKYWTIDEDKRAVIVDDFDKMPNIRSLRAKVIEELKKRFKIVVIIGGSSLRFQELITSENDAGLLTDFIHLEFLIFGHKLRSQLIRQWYTLGRVGTLDDDRVNQEVAKIEGIISIVLGRDLLPPFPTYILLLLQEMEMRHPVDISAASYGKLYQAWLTASLVKARLEVEIAFTYLSELAFCFYSKQIDSFDDDAGVLWHNWYVKEYKLPLDYVTVRDSFVNVGILSYRNGITRFKVRGAFYFFMANYLAAKQDESTCQDIIRSLAVKLYREDAANIIVFLCHLNPSSLVIDEVLANSRKLFDESPESDLSEDVRFTGDLVARLNQPVIEQGDPEKRRQNMLEARDAADDTANDPSDEMYHYRREEETERESEGRRNIAQINASMKTIQILGQIARAFAGSLLLRGDRQKQLVESCFSLSLRLLRFLFDAFKFTSDDFGKALAMRFKRRNAEISDDQAQMLANAIIFTLVEMCTVSIIRHVANSVGGERLSLTFSELTDEKPTFANRVLSAAIRLEHFSNVPEGLVIDLYEEAQDNILMRSVIRMIAYDRLNYFQCPYDVKQRICKKLGIKMLPSTLDSDRKRV